MLHFDRPALQQLDKVKRLNLVNAITGIKPANLVGTVSPGGQTNLAIFSSVVHLGSNPALLGMFVRPTADVVRHTYENIRSTRYYTVNHVHEGLVQQAHYTAAKFGAGESEFAACGFTEEWLHDFTAPYVTESHIRIGLQLAEEIPIKANGTILLVGEIVHLYLPTESISEEGHVDLAVKNGVGISGLNTYYSLQKVGSLPYPTPGSLPQFEAK